MTTRTDVLSTLVAVFSAAPTASLLDRFVAQVDNGQSLSDLVEELVNTEEFQSLTYYADSEEASFRAFLKPLIPSHLQETLLEVGVQELLNLSEQQGLSQAQIINSAVEFLRSASEDDPVWGEVKTYFNNSVVLADSFSSQAPEGAFTLLELRQVIASRSVDSESTISITGEQTAYMGTDTEDTFSAAVQNDQSLLNGTELNGAGGYDTLTATVTGADLSFSTESIEHIVLSESQGQGINLLGANIAADTNHIQLSSSGNIVVQQLAANSGSTELYIEGASGQDDNDTIEVLFTAEATTQQYGLSVAEDNSSLVRLRLLDLDSPSGELINNVYSGVHFLLDGQMITLAGDTPFTSTDSMLADLTALIAAQGLADQLQVSEGATYQAFDPDTGELISGREIVITSTTGVIESVSWEAPYPVPAYDRLYTLLDVVELTEVTQANLTLDNIGSSSAERVDVLIGTEENDSGMQGIEQLNLTITGDNWLEAMTSTNDALKTIIAERGSSSEEANVNLSVLQDVSGFYAESLTSVILTAQLTEVSQTKYDLENTVFTYQLSAGDDSLIINIADEALQADGDVNWLVDSGAGTDFIEVTSDFTGTLTITSMNGQAFDEGNLSLSGLTADQIELDFSAYLTTYQADDSDQTALTSSYTELDASEQNEIASNSIVSFDVDSEVYELLTETSLLDVFNGLTEIGELSDQSLDASVTEADLSSQSAGYYGDANREYLLIVENSDTNEFKAYQLVANVGESDFLEAKLIGAYDFGEMSVAEIFA